MSNKPTRLFQGLRQTGPYLSKILFWGLICAVARILFQSNRRNKATDFVEEASWKAVSYFVVPIMIDKNVWPLKAIVLSKQSLAKEWKNILGFGGIYYLFYRILGLLIAGIIMWAHYKNDLFSTMVLMVVPLMLFLIIVSQPFMSMLGMVLKTALYIDSISGDDVALHFDKDVLSEAVIMKKQ